MNTSKSLVNKGIWSSSRGPDGESFTGLPLLKWTISGKVKIASSKQSLGIEEVGSWISSTKSWFMIHYGSPPSQMRNTDIWFHKVVLGVNWHDWLWVHHQESTTLVWQGWTCNVSESFNMLSGSPPTLATNWPHSSFTYVCVIWNSSSTIINNVKLVISNCSFNRSSYYLYESMDHESGWQGFDVMRIQRGSLRVSPFSIPVSRDSKPIHVGTNSGRIDHIDNIAPIQCPR